jgi:hypothetical protein
MIEFMNFVSTTSPYFASGMISRFSALWRRDIYFVLSLNCLFSWPGFDPANGYALITDHRV